MNAALAHNTPLCDLSDLKGFETLASKLASSLASRGAFALSWRSLAATSRYLASFVGRVILSLLVPLGVAFLFLLDNLEQKTTFRMTDLAYIYTPVWNLVRMYPWTFVVLLLLWVVAAFFFSRGLLQEAEYHSVISHVASDQHQKAGLLVKEWGQKPSQGKPHVMHVLVATDLMSGAPMYFSREFVYCEPYGWSDPRKVTTSVALYGSAAFPGVFPPKKLKLNSLAFQNGDMPGALPKDVRLVDGGVYNNLGTDWFDTLRKQWAQQPPLLWPFGELTVTWPKIEPENIIVVNAGAPSSTIKWLPPIPLPRIMSVLYDNTVRPRMSLLEVARRPWIDIKESPFQLATRLALNGKKDCEDQASRAQSLVKTLEGKAPEFWADFSRDTSGTPTKLSSAGERTAARLMLHGYLSSVVLCHVTFGATLPGTFKGEEYFLKTLVRGEKPLEDAKKAEPQNVAPDRQADTAGHDVKEATS